VYKYELYVRITQIIADKFRLHASAAGEKYALTHVVGPGIVIAAASNGFTNAPK
jgi:hypothetical protein